MSGGRRGDQLNVDTDCCLVFVDDTGHEELTGRHAVYGLGGVVVMAPDYERLLKPRWRDLRETILGDAT